MRIAYVTESAPPNLHEWSGTVHYIRKALNDADIQTLPIHSLKDGPYRLINRVKKSIYRRVFSKVYLMNRDAAIMRHYAKQVDQSLVDIDCDAVLATGPGEKFISCSGTEKPIVIWTDAAFASLVDFYPDFSNLCEKTLRDGNEMQQKLLSKCQLVLFSSDWAARSALEHYDVDPQKVKVVPYGANIECDRDITSIQAILSTKKMDTCKLLFAGVQWSRKGGDIALQTAARLNQRGLRTEIHVVGYRLPGPQPDWVKQHGFISKSTEQGRKTLGGLFRESHFFILPSRAECCAMVLAEASSYGLPSLTTDTGGIRTAIHDGKNGKAFHLNDGPERYSDYVLDLMSNRQAYEKLCLSSFQEYTQRLNWKIAGEKARDLIVEFCGKK